MKYHKKHKTPTYFLNPQHKLTVAVIGCGGTGSQVATCLARMNSTLVAMDHPGLQVTFVDDDIVDEPNIGRQLFSPTDIGRYKSDVIAERINRFFGLNWESSSKRLFPEHSINANILISCVDSISARKTISKVFNENLHGVQPFGIKYYWLDFGNNNDTGQAILGTNKHNVKKNNQLKDVFKLFPAFKKQKDNKDEPSCSVAASIKKQDLFVNSTLAQLGTNLLWKLIHEGGLDYQGLFMNLQTLSVKPIKV